MIMLSCSEEGGGGREGGGGGRKPNPNPPNKFFRF